MEVALLKRESMYTVIVVISTLISVSAMIFVVSNNEKYIKSSVEKKIYIDLNKEDYTSSETDSTKIDTQIDYKEEEDNQVDISKNKDDFIQKDKENENQEKLNIDTEDKVSEEYNLEEKIVEDTSVFKVSSAEIFNRLTFSDKEKLLVVSSKLSPIDYACITEYLHMDDRDEGVKKAILLLKSRLSNKDYTKVKEIMNEYINIELIEENDS
jgi:hypothetical protein